MKRLKEQTHCHITITTTDLTTGERRQLSDAEVAERLQKILDIPPAVRMCFPHTPEQKEAQ